MTLEVVHVPIDQLRANPWNPNEQTPRVRQAVLESVTEFGFIDPVLVRPHPDGHGFEIVDGEHRWEAALEAGAKTVAVIVQNLTDAQAKRLTVILNETRGTADTIGLAQLLAQLEQEIGTEDLLRGLPYGADELADLVKMADIDWTNTGSGSTGRSTPAAHGGQRDEAGWSTIPIRISGDARNVAQAAFDRYWTAKEIPAEDVAWGLFLEHLAADYLGGPSA